MNRVVRFASLATLIFSGFGTQSLLRSQLSSQPNSPPDSCVPASTNILAAQYPCIYPDRRVSLRINAPGAQHVQALIGGGGAQTPKMDMTKDADGFWTPTTPPIVEGFHYYSIYVDGVEMPIPEARPSSERCANQRHRNPFPRSRRLLLSSQGCSPRRRPLRPLFLQSHRQVASLLRLHSSQ